MKKFGFTLAEVLVTLSIIGISAALTIPAVVTNVQIKTNMSRLSSTVEDLDNAFTTALAVERQPDVFRLSFWPIPDSGSGLTTQAHQIRFNGNFSKYMKFTPLNKTVSDIYGGNVYTLNSNGTKGNKWNDCNDKVCRFSNNYPIKTANGAIVYLQLIPLGKNGRYRVGEKPDNETNYITETEAMKRNTSLRCESGWAYIDVNGPDAPNTLGRDIFAFVIGQNGHLYAYGGKEYANFDKKSSDTSYWKDSTGDYSCTKDKKINGLSCTARVVDEGYKMTY